MYLSHSQILEISLYKRENCKFLHQSIVFLGSKQYKANEIHFLCHSIGTLFIVLGIYNFEGSIITGPSFKRTHGDCKLAFISYKMKNVFFLLLEAGAKRNQNRHFFTIFEYNSSYNQCASTWLSTVQQCMQVWGRTMGSKIF